jgi:AhpD family alkylhydroperoxidase
MKEGSIGVRDKELIALGIGMAVRCDGCIYAHAQKALAAGATRQQIMETAGVAVMMQGGPTYTYLPKLVEALDALETD